MDQIDTFLLKLGFDQFDEIKPLKTLSAKLGVKPHTLLGGVFLVVILLLLLEIGSFFLSSIVGYLYPAYMSFKAIESKDKKDDTQWLTFWVVYCVFTIADPVLSMVLSFLPCYYLFKTAFYVYLFHPKFRGAEMFYNLVLKNLLKKLESSVENTVDSSERQN